MHARLLELMPAHLDPLLTGGFLYSLGAAAIHTTSLVRARLRHPAFRLGISVPGQMCLVAGFFSSVWLLLLAPVRGFLALLDHAALLEALRWLDLVPFAIALASLVTSTRIVPETVRLALGDDGPDTIERVPVERHRRRTPAPLPRRPLRIVQITDPHLGPWQPTRKLRRHLEELVARDPDLVLLTGDFLTMESRGSPGQLAAAFEPLRKVSGRAFACFGNHDHEAPDEVRHALESNGIQLLIDEEARTDTPLGAVQIIGADFVWSDRERHLRELLARFPRREGELRLLLLHDPIGFQYVPKGDVDLTFSGHTHGGHIGLVSFGLDWTVMSRTQRPDQGLFAHGPNRLYVHRGTGFYGFPMRVGVPGESSLLELVV
jgi:predicted MPP superfamily phosphohydrolase